MTDPKPARAAGEQTFEDWKDSLPPRGGLGMADWNDVKAAWHARDSHIKHLDERIVELECQVGIEQKGTVGLLERIERVRALPEKWRAKTWEHSGLNNSYADELETALSEE